MKNVPSQPSNLSTTTTENSITLSWSSVSGATSYSLKKNGTYVGSTTSSSYTFSGLSSNTTYSLSVAASNSAGTSSYNTISATTKVGDTNEPNDTTQSAVSVSPGGSISSYIFTSTDIDYFKFTPNSTGRISISLSVPSANDYDLEVTNSSSVVVGESRNRGNDLDESVSIDVTSGATYYIKISGYNNSYSANPYTLTLGNVVTLPVLYLDSPIDVDLPSYGYQVYRFTASSSIDYKIITGPYGGTGTSNDTVLELYSDSGLTTRIGYNDDSNGTLFSEIRFSAVAGTSYYVKLRGYGSTAVHARITAIKAPKEAIPLSVATPVDVIASAGDYMLYKLTPTMAANYKIFTGYYGGTSSSGTSDTMIYVYTDS